MSESAATASQVVAIATVEQARGVAVAVATQTSPTATAAAQQGPSGPPGMPGDVPTLYPVQAASSFTAVHGRAYPPEVWLLNSGGELVETDVLHAPGAVTLIFPQPFTGSLYLR